MKIIYNTKKGKRYKCSSVKSNIESFDRIFRRIPIFHGVYCYNYDYWWVDDLNKWCKDNEIPKGMGYSNCCSKITNVKQFIRHLKRWEKYMSKGTEFSLGSNFQGIKNVIGKI